MNWFCKLVRLLFLVKEIISKEGVVHFRRYRLLATPWFNIYIHQILKSDEELHFHSHPWNFVSIILSGKYGEFTTRPPKWNSTTTTYYTPLSMVHHKRDDAHKITIRTPCVWTLVFTYGKWKTWGYQTEQGFIDFDSYRKLKNEGKFRQ